MALANSRPIPGAVATLGVSERVTFLRRTYGLLSLSLIGFAASTFVIMRFMTKTSYQFSDWALQGRWSWLMVMGAFMLVGYMAERLARSETSRGIQYAGLALFVFAESVILQPLLWQLFIQFGNPADFTVDASYNVTGFVASSMAVKILTEAIIITLTIFVGLTATVFVTKKDFSFMRGILMIGSFAALGIIVASLIFGFQLGAIFSGAVILLMAGYVLYQTSLVMSHFPPTHYVAAALMLFSTIATLFWYVLRLLMELNRR
jgi:FtsH-binding integral membrane protein